MTVRADALADTASALLDACHGEPELRAGVLALLAIDARLQELTQCVRQALGSSGSSTAPGTDSQSRG